MLRAALLCLTAVCSASAAVADRVALIIGNGDYAYAGPLQNAVNDATDMAQRLRSMGFEVFEGLNLNRSDTLRLVQQFAQHLDFDDTALFFYAGHGMQLGTDNYVLPVDAQPGTEAELTETSVRVQTILASMENAARTRIVILDACRNNPFLRTSGSRAVAANRGFMRMEAGVGSFIAFSTEPGNLASDGTGRNSPFTSALLRHIDTPGADIHAEMRSVRADVIDTTNETQVPWENSALIDQVFLAAQPAQTALALPQSRPQAMVAPQPQIQMPAMRSIRPGEVCLRGTDRSFCADSVLPSQGGNTYGPSNLFDNNPATAWVEGAPGTGEGQRLSFDFDAPRSLQDLFVLNGYAKSPSTFSRNARVAQMRLTTSSGQSRLLDLADSAQWQQFQLEGFGNETWMTLEITRSYPGSHHSDTALSELALVDQPVTVALRPPTTNSFPAQPRPAAPTTPYHVLGLDPNGDGFLALRAGPASGTALLHRMAEGTGLTVLGRDGPWFQVRTAAGQEGWAFSQWIRRSGMPLITNAQAQGQSCDALWRERNSVYHAAGYCFNSARGQAAFPATACIPGLGAGEVRLSTLEKARVDAIVAREKQIGCR